MSIEIPYDVSNSIPAGKLRAVPNAPDAMAQAVAWLREQARLSDDPLEQARYLGLSGGYAGMLGDHVAAREDLDQAIDLVESQRDARQRVVMGIRLADVEALAGEPLRAVHNLRQLLVICEADDSLTSLTDFVHQHLGKALLEAGEIEPGIEHLERALELRTQKGENDLIASTRQALDVASDILKRLAR